MEHHEIIRAETPRNRHHLDRSGTVLSLKLNILLAIGSILAIDTCNAIAPVEQPQRTHQTASLPTDPLDIAPDCDPDDILQSLPTVEDLAAFLQKNATHRFATGTIDFFHTYRQSPQSFQKNKWKAPCNSFAEFSAHWQFLHGGTPYIVTLRPKGFWEALKGKWHQITASKIDTDPATKEDILVIMDNKTAEVWNGSLETYIEKEYPTMTFPPFGGVQKWRLLRDTIRARIFDHLDWNAEQLEEAPLPMRNPPPKRPAPQLT